MYEPSGKEKVAMATNERRRLKTVRIRKTEGAVTQK